MRAWIVRAGRAGEREEWALTNSLAGGGFSDIPDLTGATTRDEVKAIVGAAFPSKTPGFVNNFAAQLWALRARIEDGDLVVMPRKHVGTIAIGVAKGGYRYVDDPDSSKRHAIGVEWSRSDIPRSVIKQDLLHSLGAFLTVCEVSRNEAVPRLQAVLASGQDPGSLEGADQVVAAVSGGDETLDASSAPVELETAARLRISTFIREEFAGHPMARIVAEILEADGYVCTVAEPGADGGADIVAGRGPLGLDPPWLVVQVKSEPTPVGDDVVQKLLGAMTRFKANQALLVAPGGLTSPARHRLANEPFTVRIWDEDELLDNLLRVYDKLSDEFRTQLPLKSVWVLVEGEE